MSDAPYHLPPCEEYAIRVRGAVVTEGSGGGLWTLQRILCDLRAVADWKLEAVRRWGPAVNEECSDWCAFVTSRVPSALAPGVAPSQLQDHYRHDGWQYLVACLLTVRVRSCAVRHRVISGFFLRWPTPTTFTSTFDWDAVASHIKPLGNIHARVRAVVNLTHRFLTQVPRFTLDLGKHKSWGCGPMIVGAWALVHRTETD